MSPGMVRSASVHNSPGTVIPFNAFNLIGDNIRRLVPTDLFVAGDASVLRVSISLRIKIDPFHGVKQPVGRIDHGFPRQEMKGALLRKFLGDRFYEEYMVPVGRIGIYSGDVARVEYTASVRMKDGMQGYSYSSIVPIFGSSGTYAVSQSQFVPQSFARERLGMKIYRFDELVDQEI